MYVFEWKLEENDTNKLSAAYPLKVNINSRKGVLHKGFGVSLIVLLLYGVNFTAETSVCAPSYCQ